MSGEGTFEGEHLLLRRAHECSISLMGEGIVKAGKLQVDDTVIHSRKLQVCARRNLVSSKRS